MVEKLSKDDSNTEQLFNHKTDAQFAEGSGIGDHDMIIDEWLNLITETGLTKERHSNTSVTAEDEQSGGYTIVREDVLVDESSENEATTLVEKDAEAFTSTTKLIENEEESSVKSDELEAEETTVKSGEEVIFTIENALYRTYVPVEDDKTEDRTCR